MANALAIVSHELGIGGGQSASTLKVKLGSATVIDLGYSVSDGVGIKAQTSVTKLTAGQLGELLSLQKKWLDTMRNWGVDFEQSTLSPVSETKRLESEKITFAATCESGTVVNLAWQKSTDTFTYGPHDASSLRIQNYIQLFQQQRTLLRESRVMAQIPGDTTSGDDSPDKPKKPRDDSTKK